MDCLVTGGAGFIGSHVVDALIARGDRVHVLDDLSSGRRENLIAALRNGASLHVTDVRDAEAVAAVFAATNPGVVFHLAAHVDVRTSVADPVGDAMSNVVGTINVLEAARLNGVRRVVHSSTGGAIYGDAELIPTPDDYPARPLAPYGQNKYAAEGFCELYSRLHGLSTVSLRYSNVYGPRQDIHGEAGVVAIFCGCLLEGRRPIVFDNGDQTRDWVEVSDVVRANLLAADSPVSGAVNVSSGVERSVLELIDALNLVGEAQLLDPEFAPGRPGEVRRSCLAPTRAKQELGWEPEVPLPDGLRRVLADLQPAKTP
jgi:UDP-glucose 4-epimerase